MTVELDWDPARIDHITRYAHICAVNEIKMGRFRHSDLEDLFQEIYVSILTVSQANDRPFAKALSTGIDRLSIA